MVHLEKIVQMITTAQMSSNWTKWIQPLKSNLSKVEKAEHIHAQAVPINDNRSPMKKSFLIAL